MPDKQREPTNKEDARPVGHWNKAVRSPDRADANTRKHVVPQTGAAQGIKGTCNSEHQGSPYVLFLARQYSESHPELSEYLLRIPALREELAAQPDDLKTLNDLASCLSIVAILRHRDPASASFKEESLLFRTRIIEIDPTAVSARIIVADSLLERREAASALALFQEALHLEPEKKSALFGRAQALRALGRREAASDAFKYAARAEERHGVLDIARVLFKDALELSLNDKEARDGYIRVNSKLTAERLDM